MWVEWLKSSNNSNNDHHFVPLMRDKCLGWIECVCEFLCQMTRKRESGPRGWCEDLVDKMRADRKSQPSREPFAPQDLYVCLRPCASVCVYVSLSLVLCFVSVCLCLLSHLLSSFAVFSLFVRPLGTFGEWCQHHIFAMLSFKFCHFLPHLWIPIASICINTRIFGQNLFSSLYFWSKSWSNLQIFLENVTNK